MESFQILLVPLGSYKLETKLGPDQIDLFHRVNVLFLQHRHLLDCFNCDLQSTNMLIPSVEDALFSVMRVRFQFRRRKVMLSGGFSGSE